jgi:hypothetical protein
MMTRSIRAGETARVPAEKGDFRGPITFLPTAALRV